MKSAACQHREQRLCPDMNGNCKKAPRCVEPLALCCSVSDSSRHHTSIIAIFCEPFGANPDVPGSSWFFLRQLQTRNFGVSLLTLAFKRCDFLCSVSLHSFQTSTSLLGATFILDMWVAQLLWAANEWPLGPNSFCLFLCLVVWSRDFTNTPQLCIFFPSVV